LLKTSHKQNKKEALELIKINFTDDLQASKLYLDNEGKYSENITK